MGISEGSGARLRTFLRSLKQFGLDYLIAVCRFLASAWDFAVRLIPLLKPK